MRPWGDRYGLSVPPTLRLLAVAAGAALLVPSVASARTVQGCAIASRAECAGKNLRGQNLRGADLYRANLRGANLSKARLGRANLEGANLRRANLQGANLKEAFLTGADLTGANLSGANLRWAKLRGARTGSLPVKSGGGISNSTPSSSCSSPAKFVGSDFKFADLSHAKLACADFTDARLDFALMLGTDLTSANLTRAWLRSANMMGATLTGYKFGGALFYYTMCPSGALTTPAVNQFNDNGADVTLTLDYCPDSS